MADLPYIQEAQEVKITGQDSTGNTVNYVGADSNGNMQVITPSDGPVTPGTVATKSMLAGGQFNTTLPTLTDTQQASLQLDARGRLVVTSARNITYSAAITGYSAYSTATDIFSISGSASKTVAVKNINISGIQTTGAANTVQLVKRSTSNIGGGGSPTIVQSTSTESTANSATASITVASTGSGNLLVVGLANRGGRTISSVSDGTNSFTQAAGAAASDSGSGNNDRSDVWYLLSSSAGKTSITVTFSGAAGTFAKDIWFWEILGTSISFSTANAVQNGNTASGVDTGASVTPTGSVGFAIGVCATNHTVTANPLAGNAFTSGGSILASGNAACSLLFTSSSATNPAWSDSGTGSSAHFASSTAAFLATSTVQTITVVPNNSNDPAATAVLSKYTNIPTLGTLIGVIRSDYLFISSSTGTPSVQNWIFAANEDEGIILNGASESLAINLNGQTIPGSLFNIDIEWTEM